MAGAWDKADDKGIDASLKNGIILKLSEDDKIIVTQLLTPIIENTLENF